MDMAQFSHPSVLYEDRAALKRMFSEASQERKLEFLFDLMLDMKTTCATRVHRCEEWKDKLEEDVTGKKKSDIAASAGGGFLGGAAMMLGKWLGGW